LPPGGGCLVRFGGQRCTRESIGVILTGMGEDGAIGLTHMNKNGARTIVQNKESCVVFGMPKKAIELGAAEFILPLQDIP